MLTLHKETPLDQQPDPKAAPSPGPVTPQTSGFEDSFAGFTLKGNQHHLGSSLDVLALLSLLAATFLLSGLCADVGSRYEELSDLHRFRHLTA